MADAKITACLLGVVVAFLSCAEATNYIVGGSEGWKIPSSAGAYSDWASQHTFEVGDILVFDFDSSDNDVGDVTKEDYDACNTDSPFTVLSTSPANYSLDTAGDYYFLCTTAGHCSQGQKLAITVAEPPSGPTSSPPGSPPPPSPTTGAITSPPSVGSSLGVARLVVLMSILMDLLCQLFS
ncbi:cucumber peeling cupredoxin [Eucalyptus grandis]|uniref:cucumber peeling cupredoxin n=1 Tax=Eucalyptus grandis TaxID=71139 RepID=UPI00192E858D|nr:cucumber peeling cupredoxin [Eucalyptus grandis]